MKKLESLKDKKFKQLTSEEMTKISGGYWKVVGTVSCDGGHNTTYMLERYTIFGKPTGEFQPMTDSAVRA